MALKYSIELKLTELLGLDFFADSTEFPSQLGKAQLTEGEMPDDLDFPFPRHHVDGRPDGTTMVFSSIDHKRYLQNCVYFRSLRLTM